MSGYLPKYSPDLNPIELPYSKFKDHLRKAAERTVRGLYRTIRVFVPQLGARECANYFRHAGYVNCQSALVWLALRSFS
jgi:transposase